MLSSPTCYYSPKLEGRTSVKNGRGLFAQTVIEAGEVLVGWGGEIITFDQLKTMDASLRRVTLQVEEELYILTTQEGPGDWVNHSCEPNGGLAGQIILVAMRAISSGEEICYDYAMTEGSGYDEFACNCGSHLCRRWISGDDWRLPALQERYAGYFSPYLQRRMRALQQQGTRS